MRLFVAFKLPDNLISSFHEIQKNIKQNIEKNFKIKWVEPENIHLTLKFLGEINFDSLDKLEKIKNIILCYCYAMANALCGYQIRHKGRCTTAFSSL